MLEAPGSSIGSRSGDSGPRERARLGVGERRLMTESMTFWVPSCSGPVVRPRTCVPALRAEVRMRPERSEHKEDQVGEDEVLNPRCCKAMIVLCSTGKA